MDIWALLIVAFIGFAIVWFGRWCSLRGRQEIAEMRKREDDTGRAVFFAYLADCGLSPQKAEEVYQYFQEWTGVDTFPVELDDELGRDIGMSGLDMDDTAQEIARVCGCSVPPGATFRDGQTIRNLLDIALADRRKHHPWWLGDGEAAETHHGKPEPL